MSLDLTAIVIDCADPKRQAEFWTAALAWKVEHVGAWDAEITLGEDVVQANENWSSIGNDRPDVPRLVFAKVPEGKTVKNRLHFDLKTEDMNAEVLRLVDLGASTVERRNGR